VNEKNIENQTRRRRRFPTYAVGITFLDFLVFFRERRSMRQDCPFLPAEVFATQAGLNTFLGMQKSIM